MKGVIENGLERQREVKTEKEINDNTWTQKPLPKAGQRKKSKKIDIIEAQIGIRNS